MAKRYCRPAKGSKNDDFHWLKTPDGRLIVANWYREGWYFVGNDEKWPADYVFSEGYRYVEPVALPSAKEP